MGHLQRPTNRHRGSPPLVLFEKKNGKGAAGIQIVVFQRPEAVEQALKEAFVNIDNDLVCS